MLVVFRSAGTVSLTTTLLSCAGLVLIVLMIRFLPRIPGYIVALVAATVVVYFLHLPVETVGTRFGGIPAGFPRLHVPVFEYAAVRSLISPAITVAMLGAIESLMQALQRLAEEVRASGRTLVLCRAREQPARLMAQASFAQHVGEENICPHVSSAIERARAVHEQDLAREVLI
jgi:MFS superfamily sulfate permease-like transporter